MAGEYTWLDKVTRTRKPKAHKPCMCDDCNQPCNCEGCKALAEAQARIATLERENTVLREGMETLATSLRLNQSITDVEKFARRMLAEADAAALKEPSEPPCRCSPGDTCICAYDCSCRAEFKHTYDSDEGWSNEGPAAALKETEEK